MLIVLISLIATLSIGLNFLLATKLSKVNITPNNNLRQLLQNGMVLTDAMLKARHAEEYVITQTHDALQAWENELYAAIAQFEEEGDNSGSPV